MALTDNLLAAYKLDDTSDYSGHGNTLTNTNSVTFGAGFIGNCAQFGSGNTNKVLSTSTNLGVGASDDLTISYWARQASTNQGENIELAWNGGAKWIRAYRDQANTRWALYADTVANFSSVGDGLGTNTWRHIVVTRIGTSTTLYVNTVSKLTTTASGTAAYSNGFKINGGFEGGFQDGDIDLVYVWNRALSGGEISQLYNSGSGLEITINNPRSSASSRSFASNRQLATSRSLASNRNFV